MAMTDTRSRPVFSPRRAFRTLFVRPESRLRPLDGLRALSVLWVVLFHTGWHAIAGIPLPSYLTLLFARWMLPIWRGAFGVDVFFVLSGFLIAGMLIDEIDRTGGVQLELFYLRRLMRLWPALALVVALDTLFVCDHAGAPWANLLYVSNFVSIGGVCTGWTWSLSIEEQFYLLCPWLLFVIVPLRGSLRAMALSAVIVGLCFVAAYVVLHGNFGAGDSEIVINRPLIRWIAAYDSLYSKPWMRAGPLLAGVGAAFAYRSSRVMDGLSRARVSGAIGLLMALAAAGIFMHWQLFAGQRRAIEVAYLATYRTIFGLATAYILLLSLSQHPVGRLLARPLSTQALFPIAQLAYSAYLLNPLVATVLHRAFAPFTRGGIGLPFLLLFPLDMIVTFAAATMVYVFIERPIMDMRPRAEVATSP